MNINLQTKNIELTDAIHDYVVKRVTNLEKLLNNIEGDVQVNFEVGKSTNHHKAGDVFHADCSVKINGKNFHASVDTEDLYGAIDAIKDKLFHEINKDKNRAQTLLHRGARSIKKMMKGLSKRNPFTSKY